MSEKYVYINEMYYKLKKLMQHNFKLIKEFCKYL